MKRTIVSAAVIGLSAAIQDEQLFNLKHIAHEITEHKKEIQDGIKTVTDIYHGDVNGILNDGVNIIGDIANHQLNLKHVVHEIKKHHRDIENAIKLGSLMVADSEDEELFNLKHVAQEIKKHHKAIEEGIKIGTMIIADSDEDNEFFHLKHVADEIKKHHKAIEDGIKTITQVANGNLGGALSNGVNVIEDVANHQFNIKHIVHEIKKHHKDIENAVKIGSMILADSEDDELFNLKHVAEELKKHKKEVQDGIKTVTDIYHGDVNGLLNDGVNIIGDIANHQLNVEKVFLGF